MKYGRKESRVGIGREREKQERECGCWSLLRLLGGFSECAVGVRLADGARTRSIPSLRLEDSIQRVVYHHRRSSINSVDYRGCALPARNVPTGKDAKYGVLERNRCQNPQSKSWLQQCLSLKLHVRTKRSTKSACVV